MKDISREELRQELLKNRSDFQRLLHTIQEEDWQKVDVVSQQAIQHLLAEIVQLIDVLGAKASGAAQQRGFLNYPAPILKIVGTMYRQSRSRTLDRLADSFQRAWQTSFTILEDIPAEKWENGAKMMGRYRKVPEVYLDYLEAYQQKTEQIRNILSRRV